MTPHQASELIPIMQAFADGKVVQMWMPDHEPGAACLGVWVDQKDPSFDVRYKWRVKPEPREWMVVVDNGIIVAQFDEKVVYPVRTQFVQVREVIE